MSPVVLHVHSGNLYGGIETVLTTLAREDSGGAMTHHVALCFEGRLATELRALGVPVHRLGEVRLSRPASARAARSALREALASIRPDVVVTHLPWTHAVFGRALRASCPVVEWVHGPIEGVVGSIARLSLPDALICNSDHTRAVLPPAYRGIPAEIIFNPARQPSPDATSARARTRAALGASPADVVILQASRLEPWKGHREHLRALAALAHLPAWVLWIVGGAQRRREAAYRRELESLAGSLGIASRVRFAGEQPDVAPFMAAADLYCQPNTGPEPFGMTYVEALQAGLPVVASGAGALPEIIDAQTGVLVEPGDVDQLASVLQQLIAHPAIRQRLGQAGPARARALCDPRQQLARLHAFLARARRRSAA